ncbi:S41 family peptidase [Maledivibacter halophilus]|uniref:Periplasmic protease n=1 Tax=Maledivibacter halophilus TaxID=36842 RepID=A0A1T5LU78_9FIRM|nr:S41 family peptidase [Maledivibacter halophilus]SKC79128.1 Periplasmic protease [Maledivibacter halophilus]
MKKVITLIILTLTSFFLMSCNASGAENSIKEEITTSVNSEKANIYKEDYLEAVKLIADNYIYLERKLDKSRKDFLNESIEYANSLDWSGGEKQFIFEIRKLLSKLPDGHVIWSLDKELYPRDGGMFLGLIMTVGKDNKVYVGKIYDEYIDSISEGYEIVKIDGKEAIEEIKSFSDIIPSSTSYGSMELAARNFSIEYPNMPIRDELKDVKIEYKDEKGNIKETILKWKECHATTNFEKYEENNLVLLTNGIKPSLEEIPKDVQYKNPDLLYYFRTINSKKAAILHPRDFNNWNQNDLDLTFKEILNNEPDILILDLKDTAGGAFDQVLFLSHIIGINKEFKFFYDYIDSETKMRTSGIGDFNFISDKIDFENVWNGNVILRINSICASGSDFFPRWFQINKRGKIIGMPTTGAGGGTDVFTLKNTKTQIYIPLRERIILGDDKPLEGNSIMPDDFEDGSLMEILEKTIK